MFLKRPIVHELIHENTFSFFLAISKKLQQIPMMYSWKKRNLFSPQISIRESRMKYITLLHSSLNYAKANPMDFRNEINQHKLLKYI